MVCLFILFVVLCTSAICCTMYVVCLLCSVYKCHLLCYVCCLFVVLCVTICLFVYHYLFFLSCVVLCVIMLFVVLCVTMLFVCLSLCFCCSVVYISEGVDTSTATSLRATVPH